MSVTSRLVLDLTEQGLVPDLVIRRGIQYLLHQRLEEIQAKDIEQMADLQTGFVYQMRHAEIAPVPHKANEQHYEVPADFFHQVLGQHLKYSSAYWPEGVRNLDQAEAAGLAASCDHAQLEDGQRVLELGCGWGSLSLWMAANYPNSEITAVSNSHSQRLFIESRARERDLHNLNVITCDMNAFDTTPGHYDRVVSVEMFEHMRNWNTLYHNVANWLKPGGFLFKHIFVHRSVPYFFIDNGPSDWMSRHFFTGGIMPSDDLPLMFQADLNFIRRWRWDGTHYEKTANAWLANMDHKRNDIMPLLRSTYGDASAQVWWIRWRLFFMACAELFGYHKGQEWYVSHYLFEKPKA